MTFSNPLFDSNDDFSSDDKSLSEEEFQKDEFKYFSNPLYNFDDEIITNEKILPNLKDLDIVIPIPPGIDGRCFNAESDLLESLLNRDSPIDSTKTDFIFDEFSLPCPPEIPSSQSFSQIPMEEIDLFLDNSIPSGIDNDDDSEKDILPLEELLDNVLCPLPESDDFTVDVEAVAAMTNDFDVLNNDEPFDPGGGENVVFLNVEEDDSFTFTIHTFLPFVTYPETSPLSCSTRSEDTIFDPAANVDNEVVNRMRAFVGEDGSGLRRDIVEGLIKFLDNNNALVQLFRVTRSKYMDTGKYDAIIKGDSDGSDVRTRTILLTSFTGGPRNAVCHIAFANMDFQCDEVQIDLDVDKYVSAELLDLIEDPKGHRVVSEFLMHGPCGLENQSTPYMQDNTVCSKHFSKKYSDETNIDKDSYVHYQRRETCVYTEKQNVQLDNSYVVPYNRQPCSNRVVAHIMRPVGDPSSSTSSSRIQIDEIKIYLDVRYVGPHEACWRILGFDIHNHEPLVQELVVHLENMQRVSYRHNDSLKSVVAA
ncbi:hypothetical protein Tco_0657524 [Tanacetum coccineum]|uniref:Uncharacterized protein n=1 Tax=Tanacetum coccineum TaxID=301880 RepID=A0ABQ4XCZ5_9ASTR